MKNKTMFSDFICSLTAVLSSIIMQNDSFFKFGLILTALSVIVFLICIVIIISKQNELAIKKQGVLGEDNAADVLCRRFSDDYTVFQSHNELQNQFRHGTRANAPVQNNCLFHRDKNHRL